MIAQVKIPSPGESVSEVEIASWLVEDGQQVEKDQEIAEIESDKATLPLVASESGKISIKIHAGETAQVGATACTIDSEAQGTTASGSETPESSQETQKEEKAPQEEKASPEKEKAPEKQDSAKEAPRSKAKVTPLARKLMQEHDLSVQDVIEGLRRITRQDVEAVAELQKQQPAPGTPTPATNGGEFSRDKDSQRMSSLRRKLSQRLVSVKNETAMLTTFNEVDMSRVLELRQKHQKAFVEQHGFKIGFMSFFIKAAALALKSYPEVNSMIDGENLITFRYADIGIAVQSPKGLMVPVLRNCESKSLATLEGEVKEFAQKARANRISLDDMSGGTFTITNGGTFGSLLSTPIINPPQSGILGMHNIQQRPVAVNGKVEIRPMMYTALSYDHRVIDGKSSVGFLMKIKELIEEPYNLLWGSQNGENLLLEI